MALLITVDVSTAAATPNLRVLLSSLLRPLLLSCLFQGKSLHDLELHESHFILSYSITSTEDEISAYAPCTYRSKK